MNLLTLENITKAFGERKVLDETSFFLQENEKVGVLGINGTGKSTLLKIMAGIEEPDEGNVICANHVVLRYLPQQPKFESGATVLETVMKENAGQEHWNLETEAKSMLTKLGVTDFNQSVDHLSGGEKKRLALVSALLSKSDILILDEPTNHLDHEMAQWLEDYLKKYRGALVMVTHDRYFLDRVSNRILEVDKGKLYSYQTNYAGFLELKTEREEMAQATERKRQSILRTELAWIRRGAQARSTKQKARIERYEQLRDTKAPETDSRVEIGSVASRMGKTTVELEHIQKSFGERTLINDFTYIFLKNDRIGFVGRNGCGKSTLMKIIIGKEMPDSGNITIGQTVKIGYYSQEISTSKEDGIAYMNPSMRVIDYIRNTAEQVKTTDGIITASQMLEKFLFSGEEQYGLIGKLSGGEKRRLNLLRVLMEAPNVLILDEPTNDLDITTLTILEDYLDRFEGIVIIVSHDRYFLDRCVNRIFAFEENGTLKQYEGGYTDYLEKREPSAAESGTGNLMPAKVSGNDEMTNLGKKANSEKTWDKGKKKLKFSYQEQKDYETIEEEILALEEKIQKLDEDYSKYPNDFIKLNEILKQKEENEAKLAEKMERWMYLEDLAARIEAGEYLS
ncbi:MAG: ABC-F family ATP-binding cassette domain-containing protein [Lachnospiraceae bacterium]|nr:ABC-F family ATP-binding cassette domain-containing protein [Lachnospiraceae bacterium]